MKGRYATNKQGGLIVHPPNQNRQSKRGQVYRRTQRYDAHDNSAGWRETLAMAERTRARDEEMRWRWDVRQKVQQKLADMQAKRRKKVGTAGTQGAEADGPQPDVAKSA